jgi:hypothetical protein
MLNLQLFALTILENNITFLSPKNAESGDESKKFVFRLPNFQNRGVALEYNLVTKTH